MSIEQLAAATKIPRSSLLLLEDDRYEELPGLVFAKGFLRCCARALGIEPDAVMELLYERERAAMQARRREKPPESLPPTEPIVRRTKAVAGTAASETPLSLQRLVALLPSAATLLWVVVVVLVAMVMFAALGLLGGSGPGISS